MPSNNSTVYRVTYCVYYVGNKKWLVFVVVIMLFLHVQCDDLPKNVVVMAGADKVLNCAQGGPFRWYRYLPSDPSDDKVLFMGSAMADNIDERYRVLKEPPTYPFQRLDLLITDIRANHSGTYKCKQPRSALCAELIVLGSEPKCRIHVSKNTTKETVELKCSVNVTENGEPEMLCVPQNGAALTVTSCSARDSGMITCMTRVPAEMHANYTCFIKIKHKPLRTYKTCNHAANEPDYQYTWSLEISDDVLAVSNQLTVKGLSCIIALCASATLNVVLFILYQRRRMKGHSSGKDSATNSVETLTSECESLNSEKQDDMKEGVNSYVYSASSCTAACFSYGKPILHAGLLKYHLAVSVGTR